MARQLRPCGTQSAYRRHLNRGEEPCAACRAANTARTNPGSPSALRVGEQEWDVVLAANPPKVTWRRKPNGIWVHASINDPHAETGVANKDKTVCAYGHRFTPENTLIKSDGGRLCRTCKSRRNAEEYAARKNSGSTNDKLLAAARTEI